MTPLPSPSPLCLPSGVCCTASTFTCTTLGPTCAATRATGSSSGIREGVGVSGEPWAVAALPPSDPDLSSERATSRITARMAARRRMERAMVFASNVSHTSSRRQGRPIRHGVFAKESRDDYVVPSEGGRRNRGSCRRIPPSSRTSRSCCGGDFVGEPDGPPDERSPLRAGRVARVRLSEPCLDLLLLFAQVEEDILG